MHTLTHTDGGSTISGGYSTRSCDDALPAAVLVYGATHPGKHGNKAF